MRPRGEALVAYLSARPNGRARRDTLTPRPAARPVRPDLVGDVVQRACRRAGVPHIGATAPAMHWRRNAAPWSVLLSSISQVLRHRDLATTAIYAKVDRPAAPRGPPLAWSGPMNSRQQADDFPLRCATRPRP